MNNCFLTINKKNKSVLGIIFKDAEDLIVYPFKSNETKPQYYVSKNIDSLFK